MNQETLQGLPGTERTYFCYRGLCVCSNAPGIPQDRSSPVVGVAICYEADAGGAVTSCLLRSETFAHVLHSAMCRSCGGKYALQGRAWCSNQCVF